MNNVDWLRLHLDSINPDYFRKTQNPKTQTEHIRNIELVIPLTKQSYRTLRETIEYAREKWGIEISTLVPVVDYGAAKVMGAENKLSSEEYREAFQIRADVEGRSWLLRLGTSEYPKEYQISTVMVTVYGDIIPYPALPVICGNVYRDDLKEVLIRDYDILAFREVLSPDGKQNILEEECGTCEYAQHCFGTRSMAYNNGKGLNHSDPTCWLVDQPAH